MTFDDARNLKIGQFVYHKMHGYKLEVISLDEYISMTGRNKLIYVKCKDNNGDIMRCDHKKLKLNK
jgi:heat shock protein HspQ